MTARELIVAGEMAERIRRFDWSCTPLGPLETWPAGLSTFVRVMLASPSPTTLWWGEAQTTLYNDAACDVLGAKHPEALGACAPVVWHDHWPALGQSTERAARPTITLSRSGAVTHYLVNATTIPRDDGGTAGVLCELRDETSEVAAAMRGSLLRDVERRSDGASGWLDACERSLRAIEAHPCGISFGAIYVLDPVRSRLTLAGAVGMPPDPSIAPRELPFDGNELWTTGEVLRTGREIELAHAASTLGNVAGLSNRRTCAAFVLPIAPHGDERAGVLIAGLDTTYPVDGEARDFLGGISGAVTSAFARTLLRHNRSVFESMAMSAPAAIFAKDLQGRYAFANHIAREMLGNVAVLGSTDARLLPPDIAAQLREQDRQVIETKASVRRELRIGDRALLSITFPWTDPSGQVAGTYGVAIDISERKRIEETLRRSEGLYRAIGESIDYGVWICDASGRNIYASESFLKLTGMTQEQCSDFGWGGALHPDDADATLAAWQECVRSGTLWDREHRVKGVDGRYHHVLARGVPVRDAAGNVQRWVGINLDISHLKEAEEKLRDADRRKDQFVAMLAHELRNPLASIKTSVEVMQLAGLEGAVQRDAHDVISRQVTTLVRLVEDLLDVGRITHGKFALQMELVTLGNVVRDAVETARPEIDALHHELDVRLPAEPLVLTADPVRLTQVIVNLLSNSAKYTPPGGHIRVVAEPVSDGVEISVEDDGVGIAPELQRTVFEMFSQFHGHGAGATSGLGIGLALVKELVDMHGGTVRASSGGFGKGSTFTVWLPAGARAADDFAEPQPPRSAPASPATRRRVLVVDDNVDAAESMSMLLTLLGHESKVAHDGHQAIDAAAKFEPELVLMDIGMPGMDGLEATRRIRALPLTAQPVVIAVTGWNQDSAPAQAREAGIDRHIVKPIDMDVLAQIIQSLER